MKAKQKRIFFGLRKRNKNRNHWKVFLKNYFSWFQEKKLFWNYIGFLFIAFLMQFAEITQVGQKALDAGFDYLIKKNYEWAVLQKNEKNPISSNFSLVLFDERTYKRSYTKGYRTPRDTVGLTLLRTIQRCASVVILDFNFIDDAPVVLLNDEVIDGSKKFNEYFKLAAELARQKNLSLLSHHITLALNMI